MPSRIVRRIFQLTGGSLCAVLTAAAGHAGGLYVGEFATPSTGTANAGAAALGRDASTALHNPAGMTRLDQHQLLVGLSPGFSSVEFDRDNSTPLGGGDGGDQGDFIPLFSSHYVHALNEHIRLGVGAFSVSGAALDPSNGWAGRGQATEINLTTLSVLPSLGVKITDWLSVGGGPMIVYGHMDWKLLPGGGQPRIKLDDLDDVSTAGLFGVFLEPTDTLRLGATYQTQFDLRLSGDIRFRNFNDPSVDLDLSFARRVLLSSYWQATDALAVLLSFGWEDWSTLDKTALNVGDTGTTVRLHFQDTYKVGGGLEYRLREDLLLQTGVTYDTSALQNKNRTVALPIDRQIRWGIGTIWDFSDNLTIGFNFQFADLGKNKVDNASVKGEYDKFHLFLFGVNFNWKNLPWKEWGTL